MRRMTDSAAPPALTQLPLFPLQTVLYPGGLLPLRIFEVRYLDMIARRHGAGESFGVVCLSEGTEVRRAASAGAAATGDAFAHEAFHPVGTLARITEFERPQAGLMVIRCVGAQRFRVHRSERQKYGLWVGEVEWLGADADVAVPDDLAHVRRALQGLVRNIEASLARSAEGGHEVPFEKPYRWDDCAWLANRWCELLPLDAPMKQRLLTLESPLLRLELVADTLAQMGLAPTD